MKKLATIFCALAAMASAMPAHADDYLKRDGWKWESSSICAPDGQDIVGLEGIYDGDIYTCWHSNFHAETGSPERSHPHWVMIDRGTDTTPFYGIAYYPRQSTINTHCTSYMVFLSDKDMSDTPATSTADIIAALGTPNITGSWEPSLDEKYINFTSASTARYILFVNLGSKSSSSAACAEMNLLAQKHTGGGGNTGGGKFNAVKITPADGSAPHRIAIDGTNLTISMTGTAVHLSNTGFTVEYAPEEVSYFSFENYEFAEGEYYNGSKNDIYDNPFDLVVTPAEGELTELSGITIAAAAGALPMPNPTCDENVILRRGTLTRRNISVKKMAEYAAGDAYVITGVDETTPGEYSLTIPEGFFVDSEGSRSNPLTMQWTIVEPPVEPDPGEGDGEKDSIDEVTADCPTLTLRRDGSNLIVGGVTESTHVSMVSASGVTVARVAVSGHGTAIIPAGSLPHGVYLLTANNTTLKITL